MSIFLQNKKPFNLCHGDFIPVSNSSPSFREEFIFFLNAHNISFQMKGEKAFLFPEQKFMVYLVCLSDFLRCFTIEESDFDTLCLYEDRWLFQKEFMQKHILARVGEFRSVFARKCNIITDASIRQSQALQSKIKIFLEQNHTYGNARCKYRYALEYKSEVVAVATFSASRPMPRSTDDIFVNIDDATLQNENKIIFDSYEWVRYASLPNCRVVGGMGRLLKAFLTDLKAVQDSRPIEIMTYSDTEWGQGAVYEKLGFNFVQRRKPVEFYVNRYTGERISVNKVSRQNLLSGPQIAQDFIKICNCGSRKYLLQIL